MEDSFVLLLPSAKASSRALPAPQPARRDARALGGCGELHPDDLLRDVFAAGESAKTTIRSGDHPLTVTNHGHGFLDPPGDKFRMLDEVRCGIEHAGHEQHMRGQRIV